MEETVAPAAMEVWAAVLVPGGRVTLPRSEQVAVAERAAGAVEADMAAAARAAHPLGFIVRARQPV